MDQHKYIKLLDYAIKQERSYHMEPALIEADMTEDEFVNIRDSLFINAHTQAPPPNKNQSFEWRLKSEAVFGYLAYKQYEHAQSASKNAIYIAVTSLVVSMITLGVTAYSVWL